MATRFNPPPGWDIPEGKIMPEFWMPKAEWPKAPDDWNFYLDDNDNPVDPPRRAWLPPKLRQEAERAEEKDFNKRKLRGWLPFWITVVTGIALVFGWVYVPNVGKVWWPVAQVLLEWGHEFAGVKFGKGFVNAVGTQREQLPAEYAGGSLCKPWWEEARQTKMEARRRTVKPRGDLIVYVRADRAINERVLTNEIPCRNQMRALWGGAPLQVEEGTVNGARWQKFTSDDDPRYQYTVVRVAYRNMVVEMNTIRGMPTVDPPDFARKVVHELDKWKVWGPWEASEK